MNTEIDVKLKNYLFFCQAVTILSKISIWVLTANFKCMSCQCSETEMNGMDFKVIYS